MPVIIYILLMIISFVGYGFLMSNIFPKYLLKITYDLRPILGRGLKKFKYPDGRAVLYESHPEIRKYVERYALFTLDGYKYVQFTIGSGVRSFAASVIMLDNKDKVIDVLLVNETARAAFSRPFKIHEKTSYVAISLSSVNDMPIPSPTYASTKLREILIYFFSTFILSFFLLLQMNFTVRKTVAFFSPSTPYNTSILLLLIPSILIGLSSLAALLLARIKNGIKVVTK